jgi:DNA (cytosine-5)-methyltransferase 1
MRVGALFAGYGGLDLAVQQVWPDAKLAWVSEIDKNASKVLAHNWPGVPNLGDITKVDWDGVPPVDILTGGFPCQDVSTAGLRAGLRDGTRTGLWAVMAHAIDRLQPKIVIIENVSGLRSAHATADDVEPCPMCLGDTVDDAVRALGTVLADLAARRFAAEWVSVRASDIGACHQRERVFIVAVRDAAGA